MILLHRVPLACVLVAAALTTATAVAHFGLAPRSGFVRSFYPTADFDSVPVQQARATDVSLDFLRVTASQPRRSFGVKWKGFWYVPESRTLALHVRSDDEVQVLVDSDAVIRKNPRDRQRTSRRSVTLAEGAHEIVIRYRQYGQGMGLDVFSSLPGEAPAPLPMESIFAGPVTRLDMAIATAVPWLAALSALAWMMAAGVAIADRLAQARRGRWHPVLATPRVFANRLRLVAGPALVVPVVLFFLGPFTIYTANPDEFVVPFTGIVWPWVIGAVVLSWSLLLGLAAVACLSSERLARTAASVLLALGFLLWVQGTFLVPDYGPMYGEALDLGAHAGRVPYELALWGGVLAVAIVYAGRVSAIASTLSLLFAGLQIAGAVVALANPVQTRAGKPAAWRRPPPEMYALSRSKNVIHIVLDAYMSELFGEAVAEDRAYFDRAFAGFVFFADHLGAFPTTRASMPAMLTGELYRNQEPFDTFLRRVLQQRSIASALSEHRFKVRSITFHPTDHFATDAARSPAVQYTIPTPFGSYADYVRFMALQLFDFAAFRYVPQVLKASVYNDDAWLWQRALSANALESQRSRMARASNHAAFLSDMADRLSLGVDGPVYQYIHVALPHPPVVVDADCSLVAPRPTSRRSYAGQSRCAVTMVVKILDRLRGLGVYDQSAVILVSDHGWRATVPGHPLDGVATPAGDLQRIAQPAMPLLAVKPLGGSGPLRVSMAPTAITDVPATIADLAGLPSGLFPGEPALRLAPDARRPRTFAFHSWGNADWGREYIDALHVFSVNGPIHEPGSWRFQQTIADPSGGATRR